MKKVFVEGGAGTTGLKIRSRLKDRKDIALITLPEEKRKDALARKEAFEQADVVFLCLPDDAAREAVDLMGNAGAAVIDTSTAHRTNENWVYGLPELTGQKEKIKSSTRIANPGCHATGFISLVAPLVAAGLLKKDVRLSCFSLTGYSGGGKKMIAQYEDDSRDPLLDAPRLYGLPQTHKHLPEMQKICGLLNAPAFCPVVADYYAGMETVIPLNAEALNIPAKELSELYREYYKTGLVRYADSADEGGFLSAGAFAGRDDMQVSVFGGEERILLTARFDNLGKGASGAAIQCFNIMAGLPEETGLVLGEGKVQ
jgi:N-acetyl-gamma-glutamyl-phosphate reductase